MKKKVRVTFLQRGVPQKGLVKVLLSDNFSFVLTRGDVKSMRLRQGVELEVEGKEPMRLYYLGDRVVVREEYL